MKMRDNFLILFLVFCFNISLGQTIDCANDSLLAKVFVEDYAKRKLYMTVENDKQHKLGYLSRNCLDSTFIDKARAFLGGDWDEERLRQSLIKSDLWDSTYISGIVRKITSPKDTTKYKIAMDSVYNSLLNMGVRDYSNRKIRNQTILAVGELYLYDLIPDLQWALTNPYMYDTETVRLALARLGDTTQLNHYYLKYKDLISPEEDDEGMSIDKKGRELLYINTDSSINLLFREFTNNQVFTSFIYGEDVKYYIKIWSGLYKYLFEYFSRRPSHENFYEEIRRKRLCSDSNTSIKIVEECNEGIEIYKRFYEKMKPIGFRVPYSLITR
jgi:hypothetical protein